MRKLIFTLLCICSTFLLNAQTIIGNSGTAIGAIPDSGVVKGAYCFPLTVSNITANGGIIDSTYGLFSVKVNISHTYDADLIVTLKAPDGTTILLSNQNGSSGANYTNTTFTSTALTSIASGLPPYTGSYLPEGGNLGSVNNKQKGNGIWYLCIQDISKGEIGTLNSWSLTFNNTPALAPAPRPNCTGNSVIATNTCNTAPFICNLNGFCGSTSAIDTAYEWPQLTSTFLNCKSSSIQNNSFIKFIAASTTATFNVWVFNSQYGDGIQMLFFNDVCGSGAVKNYGCTHQIPVQNTPFPITARGLTVGQSYYLMFDGYGGDVCDYTVQATSGVNMVNISLEPDSITVCRGTQIKLHGTSGGGNTFDWSSYSTSPTLANTTSALSSTNAADVILNTNLLPNTVIYDSVTLVGTALGSCPATATATFHIIDAPTVSQALPLTQTGLVGFVSTPLTVSASGTNVTYQWYVNTINQNWNGKIVSGATSATFTPPTNAAGTYYYYCLINNGVCAPHSNAVEVIVNTGPVCNPDTLAFVQQPTTVPQGSPMSPSVTVKVFCKANGINYSPNNYSGLVTLTVMDGCGYVTQSVNAVNGLATFNNIIFTRSIQKGVSLVATAATITSSSRSDTFSVTTPIASGGGTPTTKSVTIKKENFRNWTGTRDIGNFSTWATPLNWNFNITTNKPAYDYYSFWILPATDAYNPDSSFLYFWSNKTYTNGNGEATNTATFDNVTNLSNYNNLNFSFSVAALDGNYAPKNAMTKGDSLHIDVSTDNGTTWKEVLSYQCGNSYTKSYYLDFKDGTLQTLSLTNPRRLDLSNGSSDWHSKFQLGLPNGTSQFQFRVISSKNSLNKTWAITNLVMQGDSTGTSNNCTTSTTNTIASNDFETPLTGKWSWSKGTGASNDQTGILCNAGNCYLAKTVSNDNPNDQNTVTFSNIKNLSKYSNVTLSFAVASLNKNGAAISGTPAGNDSGDDLFVETSTDGGANWKPLLKYYGFSNSLFPFSSNTPATLNFGQLANYGGSTTLGYPSSGGGVKTNAQSAFKVILPTGTSQFQFRFTANNDQVGETWDLDNVKLEGDTLTPIPGCGLAVPQSLLPTLTVSGDTSICAPLNNIGSAAQLYSDTANTVGKVTYAWFPSVGFSPNSDSTKSNPKVSPSANQQYTLTITDADNCKATAGPVNVLINKAPILLSQTTPAQTICYGAHLSTFNVLASSTEKYQWYSNTTASTSGGTPISGATAPTFIPDSTLVGTHYYYCVLGGNCSPSATSAISGAVIVNALPTVTTPLQVCVGSTVTLSTISGGTWVSNDISLASITNAGVVTGIATGAPTFTFTDANHCSSTTNAITVNALPVITVNASDNPICPSSATTLTASGADSYSWSGGPATANYTVSPASTTTYTVTGTNNTTSCSNNGSITITTGTSSTASVSIAANPSGNICAGTNVTFTATPTNGGTTPTYQWYKNGSLIASGVTFTYIPAKNDKITCSMISSSSCVTISTATSNELAPSVTAAPNAGSISGTQNICTDGTITQFTSTGDAGGTWTSATTSVATISATGVITPIAAGSSVISYTVNGTGGCTDAVATKTISVNGLPTPLILTGSSVCSGISTTITSSTSELGVNYQLYNSTNSTVGTAITGTGSGLSWSNVLSGTNYYVIATNANNCTTTSNKVNVVINASPTALVLTGSTICADVNGGTITSTTSTLNVNYQLYNNNNIAVGTAISGTGNAISWSTIPATTDYYVIASNTTTTCTSTSNLVDITEIPLPIPLVLTGSTVCSGTITSITSSTSETGMTYQLYNSSNAVVGTSVSGTGLGLTWSSIIAGTNYYVKATNANNCVSTSNKVDVIISSAPKAGTITGTQAICSNGTTTFTSNGDAGGVWSSGTSSVATVDATTGIITPVTAGSSVITYTVSGASGCTDATATRTVTVTALPNAGTISGTQAICSNGTTTFTTNGNTGGAWSSGTTAVATINATSGIITPVAAGTSIITYTVVGTGGCSNVSATRTVTVTKTPKAGTITGTQAICSNGTTTFTSNGDAGGAWSSGTSSVATVDATTGIITPVTAGSSVITYTVSGASGCTDATATRTVTVTALPNAGTISGTQAICSNGTTTFTTNGNTGGAWSSGTTAVATINATSGIITPVAAGTCIITYTVVGTGGCSNVSATRTVTVTKTPKAGTITGTQAICSNGTTTFATNGDAGGVWSSGTASVATVDATTGIITPVAAGSSVITYIVSGTGGCTDATATRTVTVTALPNAGTISGTQAICSNGTTTFTTNGNTGGAWSSGTTAVATINATSGIITPVAAGTSIITYTVVGTGGCSNVTATRTVTVTKAPKAGTISGTQAICSNGTTTFATNGDAGGVWSSGTTSVSTIDATTGIITPVAAGSSVITYTVSGTGGCTDATATRTVTVTALPNAGTISGTQAICSNGTTTFTTNGNTGGAWSSGTTAVATINATSGIITPIAAGTSIITYTVVGTGGCSNVSATRTVTVTKAPKAGTISGTQAICSNGTTTFATNGDAGGVWSSGTTSVATIDATTGIITPVAAGSSVITYMVSGTGGCTDATATRTVTVTALPNAGTISGTQTICSNGTTTFTTNGNTGGAWSSGTTAVATINATSGIITPIAAGTSIITYTVVGTGGCSNVSATRTVTVTKAPKAGTITGTQAICSNGTTTFATNGDAGGVWSSGTSSVATIDATTGIITPVAAGSSVITYTVSGTGGCTDVSVNRTVTVNTLPTATISTTTPSICSGTDAVFNITGTLNATVNYIINNGIKSITETKNLVNGSAVVTIPNADITQTVNLVSVVNSTTGCFQTFTGTSSSSSIIVKPSPIISTAPIVPACGITSVDLNTGITSPTAGLIVAYYSDPNFKTQITNLVANGGIYYVNVTKDGCSANASIRVSGFKGLPLVLSITGDSQVCIKETILLANKTTAGVWESSNTNIATINANGYVTGVISGKVTIKYTVTSDCGSVFVVKPMTVTGTKIKPTITPTNPTCLHPMQGEIKFAFNGSEVPYRVAIDTGNNTAFEYAQNLVAGTYKINIFNSDDCLVYSGTQVLALTSDGSCDTLYIPSAFLPESNMANGVNKYLKPFGGASKLQSLNFRVYNRYGNLVFQTQDIYSFGWDGRYNGIMQPTGTYVWEVEYTISGNRKVNKGYSVLIR